MLSGARGELLLGSQEGMTLLLRERSFIFSLWSQEAIEEF